MALHILLTSNMQAFQSTHLALDGQGSTLCPIVGSLTRSKSVLLCTMHAGLGEAYSHLNIKRQQEPYSGGVLSASASVASAFKRESESVPPELALFVSRSSRLASAEAMLLVAAFMASASVIEGGKTSTL